MTNTPCPMCGHQSEQRPVNSAQALLEQHISTVLTAAPGGRIPSAEVRASYLRACAAADLDPLPVQAYGRALRRILPFGQWSRSHGRQYLDGVAWVDA